MVTLTLLEKVLHPFWEVKHALERDQYVSVLLIVIIIKTLYDALLAVHATAAPDFPPELEAELSNMVIDFESHWDNLIIYAPYVVHGVGNPQVGILTVFFGANLLDPRTKLPTLPLLSEVEAQQVWANILAEPLCISAELVVPILVPEENQSHYPNNNNRDRRVQPYLLIIVWIR